MTPADAKYVKCDLCGTWRYPGATHKWTDINSLDYVRCKDAKWCDAQRETQSEAWLDAKPAVTP